jgi:hypothetical protein
MVEKEKVPQSVKGSRDSFVDERMQSKKSGLFFVVWAENFWLLASNLCTSIPSCWIPGHTSPSVSSW